MSAEANGVRRRNALARQVENDSFMTNLDLDAGAMCASLLEQRSKSAMECGEACQLPVKSRTLDKKEVNNLLRREQSLLFKD